MRSRLFVAAALALGLAGCSQPPAPAPAPPPAPPSTANVNGLKASHALVKDYLTRAAEQMPEAKYAYKPTPDVRSFGELIGHVADSNYYFCADVTTEAKPKDSYEKLGKKADLQKALADSFAYCDRAYGALNDTTGAAEVKIDELPQPVSKLGVLSFNTSHDFEHYGNIVTYMRLNKMVPPSSQPASK